MTIQKVLTHNFGIAKLKKLYRHPQTGEYVWDVMADSGGSMHLSQSYVATLPVVTGK